MRLDSGAPARKYTMTAKIVYWMNDEAEDEDKEGIAGGTQNERTGKSDGEGNVRGEKAFLDRSAY
jgi:hypothetical protein